MDGTSQPRFKQLVESGMSDAQRKVYKEIAAGPRAGVRGPFNALLRSPELADRAQKLGEYVRFNASLPERLKEFAILITARHWTAQYEWHSHQLHALKAGLAPQLAADLARGKRPAGMQDDEAAVYDFCRELHENKAVSDPSYKAVVDKFMAEGYNPEGYTLYTYAAIQAFAAAAEKAKSVKVDDLSKALHSMTVQTVVGPLTWDKKGDVTDPKYVFYIWKNGTYAEM